MTLEVLDFPRKKPKNLEFHMKIILNISKDLTALKETQREPS